MFANKWAEVQSTIAEVSRQEEGVCAVEEDSGALRGACTRVDE